MKRPTPTGQPIVYDDGLVVHHGQRIGKVLKLRTGWVWAFPGGNYSTKTYRWRDYAVAALVDAVTAHATSGGGSA